jgi:hypothetical protein
MDYEAFGVKLGFRKLAELTGLLPCEPVFYDLSSLAKTSSITIP